MTNRDPDGEVGGGGASPPHMTGDDPKPYIITQASEDSKMTEDSLTQSSRAKSPKKKPGPASKTMSPDGAASATTSLDPAAAKLLASNFTKLLHKSSVFDRTSAQQSRPQAPIKKPGPKSKTMTSPTDSQPTTDQPQEPGSPKKPGPKSKTLPASPESTEGTSPPTSSDMPGPKSKKKFSLKNILPAGLKVSTYVAPSPSGPAPDQPVNQPPTPKAADPATPKPAKPRGQKRALAALALDPNLRDQWFELPGGWRKQIVTRKQGATAGGYDVYIYPPVGKKLRSNNDILRWVQANPTEEIDCVWVNMKVPLNQSGEINVDHSVEELIDRVLMVKETGELPSTGMFKNACQSTTKPVNGATPKPPKAKKAKQSPPPKQPFQLTPAQAMQLEIYYHNTAVMPGPKMLKAWSAEMNINAKDVKTWFQSKWKARLESEARLKSLQLAAPKPAPLPGDSVEVVYDGLQRGVQQILQSRRPINPDVFSSTLGISEPEYHTTDSDQHFVIEYDNEEGGGDGDEVAVAFAPPGFQAGQAPQQNEAQQEEEHSDDEEGICMDNFLSTEIEESEHEISL